MDKQEITNAVSKLTSDIRALENYLSRRPIDQERCFELELIRDMQVALKIIQSEQKRNSFSWECPICHTIIGLDLSSKEESTC